MIMWVLEKTQVKFFSFLLIKRHCPIEEEMIETRYQYPSLRALIIVKKKKKIFNNKTCR